ncbi:hypothetical protein B566_EDAN014317 [Ephemera danica]|nr:hypothetical protein B566_EDAN014317 [Ephemera danica]
MTSYGIPNDSSDASSRSMSPKLEDSILPSSTSSQIASHRFNTREESNEKTVVGKSISKDVSNKTARSSSKLLIKTIDDIGRDEMDDLVISDKVKFQQLRMLYIDENFEVFEGHRIETSMFRNPNEKVVEALEELGMIDGKRFSPFEDDAIRRNWKRFCKLYNFDVERDPIYFTTGTVNGKTYIDPKEHIKFARFLGQGLPKRSLRSIVKRFNTKLNPAIKFIGTRFDHVDDEFILKHREGNEILPFKAIAKKVARTEYSVKQRYYKLKEYDFIASGSLRKYFEDKDLLSKQIKLIMKTCGFTSIDDLREKTRDMNYPIPWPLINRLSIGKDRISAELWGKYLHTALHITQVYDAIDVTLGMIQICPGIV